MVSGLPLQYETVLHQADMEYWVRLDWLWRGSSSWDWDRKLE